MGEIRITQADQFPLLRSVRDELTYYDTDTLNSQMGDALRGIAGLDAVEVGVMSATKEWDLSTCPYFREMATALNELYEWNINMDDLPEVLDEDPSFYEDLADPNYWQD